MAATTGDAHYGTNQERRSAPSYEQQLAVPQPTPSHATVGRVMLAKMVYMQRECDK